MLPGLWTRERELSAVVARRYFNAAARKTEDGWSLEVWEPYGALGGEIGETGCTDFDSAVQAVETYVHELLRVPVAEMTVSVYKVAGGEA